MDITTRDISAMGARFFGDKGDLMDLERGELLYPPA
jgi:hypothetical protein